MGFTTRLLLGAGAFTGVAALAAGAVVSLSALSSLPQLHGQLTLPGLSAPVQVKRDASDVTHILASAPLDAYRTLGMVHAQERAWQLEFNRRVMHGTLSEVFGPTTLDTDKLLRTLGIRQGRPSAVGRFARRRQSRAAGLCRWRECPHGPQHPGVDARIHPSGHQPPACRSQRRVLATG